MLLVVGGCAINVLAYLSLQPLLVALIFYMAGVGVLHLPKLGGVHERHIFTRVFVVGFLMAGIAAVYRNHLGDLQGDASSFFEMAAGQATGITLDDLRVLHEGALAIVMWSVVYDIFAAVGFGREQYVGISVNVAAVAFTGVFTLKMARQIYGHDLYRFKQLAQLVCACGLFWLFAGIHLRDAVVLLAVTVLAYVWLWFLAHPNLGFRLLLIAGASLLAVAFFGFLRLEFVFVPIAMAAAGVTALMLGHKTRRNRLTAYLLIMIGIAVTAGLLITFGEPIGLALSRGQEGYLDQAMVQHDSGSLGMELIVNQPAPIRLTLGFVYLFVFPIPFWSGFQLETVYHLFKSFNALFFYFLIPLLGLAVRQLWKRKAQRTPALLFILFLSLGFTLAVAGTSLETRHFGTFLAPMFVLALLPDLQLRSVRNDYGQSVLVVFGGVVVVHVLWLILKAM